MKGFEATHYWGLGWRDTMSRSKYSLCPRGSGRTSYHLAEALQMGLLPVQVHLKDGPYNHGTCDASGSSISDEAWIPYEALYRKIGFTADLTTLPDLFAHLMNVSAEEHRSHEKFVGSLRLSHFTYSGVMDQIGQFMSSKRVMYYEPGVLGTSARVSFDLSDLICRALPFNPTNPQSRWSWCPGAVA